MKTAAVNKIVRINSLFFFSLVLIFGIVYLSLFLVLNKPIPENFVKTEAKIARIEEELSPVYDESDGIGADDYEYSVFVTYTYNGETFSEKEYGRYDSSMKEGDTVLLYVDPDAPGEFMSDPSGGFVFIIIGIAVILIGGVGIGANIYKKKRGQNDG